MGEGYPVPSGEAHAELRFSNSRFLGTVGHAEVVGEAKSFVEDVRRRYADASHHVYAFAIGHGAIVTHGMSDDGEPSGTAGRPVLSVVKGSGLGDVVLVVTRYFGGTKLGTGGLVKAYTETAQAALRQTIQTRKVETIGVRICAPYELYERCRSAIVRFEGRIESEDFADQVVMNARVPGESFSELRRKIQDLTGGQLDVERE